MKIFLYYLTWFIKCKIFKKEIPLNGSIVITDECNLNCKHCTVANLGYEKLSFKKITNSVQKLYDMGIRALVLTGGEPFLWKDGIYNLENVVEFAKRLGFFWIVICTIYILITCYLFFN